MWKVRGLVWCLGWMVAVMGCRQQQAGPPVRRVALAKASQPINKTEQPPALDMGKKWLSQTWLDAVAHDFNILVKLLRDVKPEEKTDVRALLLNRYKQVNESKWLNPKAMTPLHRAMRTRLHLRLARFYQQAFAISLRLQADVFERRLRRQGKLKVGQLFPYYRGRLLCLQRKFGEAAKALGQAAQQVGPGHKLRVQAWLAVCQKDPAQRQKAAAALAKYSWAKEPAGWSEWVLLHAYFQLPTKTALPATLSPRAAVFARIWQTKAWQHKPGVMRAVVDTETISEGSVSTESEYFDPAVLWMAARHHAQAAQHYLTAAAKGDRFAPFFRAQAWTLLERPKKALAEWQVFLKNPPKAFDWGYAAFSNRMRLIDYVLEAKARVALLQHQAGQTQVASQQLEALAKGDATSRIWAGWGLVQIYQGQPKSRWFKPWSWLWAGAELAAELEKDLLKHYLKLQAQQKGAAAIVQYRLYRYAVRNLYLLASQGALWTDSSDKAVRWLEHLHHKEKPYMIGNENQPDQLMWTVRAYTKAGRWEVSTLFMAKNKDAFPALTQHWSLFRLMRIFRGMGNSQGPKGG